MEEIGGEAAGAGCDGEDAAGKRLCGAVGGGETLVRRGDEKRGEIGAAERAGRDAFRGKVDRGERGAGFVMNTADTTAVPEGDPEVSVGIDAHAVGQAVVVGKGGERRAVADVSGVGIPAEAVDAMREGIDEVELAPGDAPREAVAAADVAEDALKRGGGV